MPLTIKYLKSADRAKWIDGMARSDGLPSRKSGPWIEQKHAPLLYYSEIFNKAMQDKGWTERIYVDLFAGPGKCHERDNGKEDLGSPLKVLEKNFTKFIFVEMSAPAAEALAQRLGAHAKANRIEIWCGDCADAIHEIQFPKGALTLTFIDPTKIGHCPFSLMKTLATEARSDILVNIPIGTDIKRNFRRYIKQTSAASPLSRYLGCDDWENIPTNTPANFCRGIFQIFEKQLNNIGYSHVGDKHQVVGPNNVLLYYLFFASKNSLGKKFWNDTLKYLSAPRFRF
jgi:three-Cys-motif partner protein